jgi:hypothetical protein
MDDSTVLSVLSGRMSIFPVLSVYLSVILHVFLYGHVCIRDVLEEGSSHACAREVDAVLRNLDIMSTL